MLLEGKAAVVTGAGRGMGRFIAIHFAREGADVACVDIADAERTAADVRSLGRRALGVTCDVAQVDQIEAMVEQVLKDLGRIDILINCAGVMQTKPLLDITEADWDRIVDVNQKGLFFCLQAVARHMVQRGGGGAIVNFSSVAGRSGRPYAAHYSASKFAVIGITRSAALAFAPHKIRVNAVCPGIVDTPMWQQIDRERAQIFGLQPGEAIKQFVETVPLKRIGTPQDVANVVTFLCSDLADYVTGQAINVDGGVEMD